MAKNVFLVSDTHFSHKNIINFEPKVRIFNNIQEHDEALVQYWNETVKPDDVVYHLGDVVFAKTGFDYVKRLNGRKKLILGNHDRHAMEDYRDMGFEEVDGCFRLDEILLTHYPIARECLGYTEKYNVHGHTHQKWVGGYPYYNVSVENIDLRPISLDEVAAAFRLRYTQYPTTR